MGLFSIFLENNKKDFMDKNEIRDSYADSKSISLDERPYYQPDDYYTYESYPGTPMAEKVVLFEERKKTSFPSKNGLYVAEILLLEYCKEKKYPKPTNGYPGFWWFKYGIRDIGHCLESLAERGFIKWASKKEMLSGLKVSDLKKIAQMNNLNSDLRKEQLVDELKRSLEDNMLPDELFLAKYELTELGKEELKENEYVIYMHRSKYKTRDDTPENISFTVWDVNRLLGNKDKTDWKKQVADLEEKRIGIRIADKECDDKETICKNENNYTPEEIENYIKEIMPEIIKKAKEKGDGYQEEIEGISYKNIGDYKKALYYFYIAIEKKFDAPALYIETSKILRRLKLYDEELRVLSIGLSNVSAISSKRKELQLRKDKVLQIKQKNNI